jgi:hypothetical protein
MGAWKIEPLVGVSDVRLGMSYDEVVGVLGEPSQTRRGSPGMICYWPQGVSVHFNPDAEFIEIARRMGLSPTLLGAEVFVTRADDLVQVLAAAGHDLDSDTERGHSFVFRDLQVGLWRASVPEDNDDAEGHYFDSVGLGMPGYYT